MGASTRGNVTMVYISSIMYLTQVELQLRILLHEGFDVWSVLIHLCDHVEDLVCAAVELNHIDGSRG